MKHFMVVVAFANILTASAEIVRSNDWFTVQWNDSDGTLSSLVMHNDKSDMNWIEGTDRWGAIRLHRMDMDPVKNQDTWGDTTRMEFVELRQDGQTIVSVYQLGPIHAEVRRLVVPDGMEESYVFKNTENYPVYFLRGHLGILATFNDSYAAASISETKRCHAHIWCGGENSWIRRIVEPLVFGILADGVVDGTRCLVKKLSLDERLEQIKRLCDFRIMVPL